MVLLNDTFSTTSRLFITILPTSVAFISSLKYKFSPLISVLVFNPFLDLENNIPHKT